MASQNQPDLNLNPAPSLVPTSVSLYQPPAIIHRGTLETRAGSPFINDPFDELFDPDSPLNTP